LVTTAYRIIEIAPKDPCYLDSIDEKATLHPLASQYGCLRYLADADVKRYHSPSHFSPLLEVIGFDITFGASMARPSPSKRYLYY